MESVDTERSDAEEGITAWRTRGAGFARTQYVYTCSTPLLRARCHRPVLGLGPFNTNGILHRHTPTMLLH